MIDRYDLQPMATVIPKETLDTIARVGGRNIYGEPMYRLVLAECRTRLAAGAWVIWPEGSNPEDRGGTNIQAVMALLRRGATEDEIKEVMEMKPCTPLRTDHGTKLVPEYGDMQGFILEKWKPNTDFGPPEEWERWRYMGECALGPYPSCGLYELCAGPAPTMPSASECETAIRRDYQQMMEKPISAKQRALSRINQMRATQEQADKELLSVVHDYVTDGPASLYKRCSLAAGRVTQELATAAGMKGHAGN